MSFGADGLGEPAGEEVALPSEGGVDVDLLDDGEDESTSLDDDRAIRDGVWSLDGGDNAADLREGISPPPYVNEDRLSAQQVAALRIDPTVDVYAPDLDRALALAALERRWKARVGGAITVPLRAVLRTVLEQLTEMCGVAKKELREYVADVLAD